MAGKNGYVAEDHEGKLYRVRDKNITGKSYIVWGENLTHEKAHELKERICGAEKSKSARLEDMSLELTGSPVDPKGQPYAAQRPRASSSSLVTSDSRPDPDLQIQAAKQRALSAARIAADAAQTRAALVQHPPVVIPPAPNGESEIVVPDNIEDEMESLLSDGGDLPA